MRRTSRYDGRLDPEVASASVRRRDEFASETGSACDEKPTMRDLKAVVPTVLWFLWVPIVSGQEWPREPIPAPRIRGAIQAHHSGIAVWWTGHNGWLIKSENLLIGTDLATEDEA